MKRRIYNAVIVNTVTGQEIAATTTSAWNSGIRATQDLLREYARSIGTTFTAYENGRVVGDMTDPDRQYIREWRSPEGRTVTASVWEQR